MPTVKKKPAARRVARPPAKPAGPVPKEPRVHAYARAVVEGRIVAGHLVRLACQRHLDDLKNGPARGLVWHSDKAEAVLVFAEDVVFLEDEVPLKLDDFQAFILGSLFGWYRSDGYRRFRYGYVEIGKGNGKTPLAAVIGLYGLVMDKEHAPEVYSAAVSADQAKICFKDARIMVEKSPELRDKVHVQVASLTRRDGVFRPISSEQGNLSGNRVHIGIIDELHEHPDDKVSAKIRSGTKRRRNALILEITNAPFGNTSVCAKHHNSSVKILEGVTPNDAWFAYIATLDPCPACREKGLEQPDEKCPHCDDWRNPATWAKANPGLNTILPESYLREQVGIAQTVTSEENLIKRLNFCLRTEQAVRWINMQKWDASGRVPVDFGAMAKLSAGRSAIGGLDLATTTDFAAFALCFDSEKAGGARPLLPFFFLPKATLEERIEATGIRFDTWAQKGLIHLTDGDMIDFEFIRATIKAAGERWNITRINYDRRNADWIIPALMKDGFEMVPFNQSIVGYNGPSRAFERLVLAEKLLHAGHEVLRWMASNVTIATDSTGNIKPDKEKSTEKIDGITASVMALGGWIENPPEEAGEAGVMFMA